MRIREDIDDGTPSAEDGIQTTWLNKTIACFKHETMRCYSVVIGTQL